MTQEEKELRLQQLNELQFKLKKEIERGDEHAIKCVKKGLVYSEEYPDEYALSISSQTVQRKSRRNRVSTNNYHRRPPQCRITIKTS